MSLAVSEARRQLDDTTFLLGGFRRRAALQALAGNPDPAAATALVEAVDAGSRSATEARAALAADANAAWTDRMWEIWRAKRQEWLGAMLRQKRIAFAGADAGLRTLSQLKLGGGEMAGEDMAAAAAWVLDKDTEVQAGVRTFVEGLDDAARRRWAGALPIDREVALVIGGYFANPGSPLASAALAYAERVIQAGPDFLSAFLLKAGLGDRIPANRAWTIDVLRQRADPDAGLAAAATQWVAALPDDQQLNDVVVDEWLRSKDDALFALLRDRRRLPSDPGKETLLLLLWGDIKGYQALGDLTGRLLAEALSVADAARRQRIVEVLQGARDAALADQLRRATLQVQGMDTGLGLRALMASGDEDRIADAAREMRGKELFDLVRRWSENGRRPKDPRKRAAVDQAVAALKDLPKIEVEPAPKLPDGLDDLLEVWAAHQGSEDEWRRDLQAPDPLIRARALFVGARTGKIDQATLRAKASSEDWPERFVAALNGAHPDPKNDHVYWINVCAGEDGGTQEAQVACGPDEFERTQARLVEMRGKGTPLARVWAGELTALQAFRALEMTTITVTADDAATQKDGLQEHGDVTADDMARIFAKPGPGPAGNKGAGK